MTDCRMRGCDDEAVYRYRNPYSGASGAYCAHHLGELRPDISVEYWLENGFAKPLRNKK